MSHIDWERPIEINEQYGDNRGWHPAKLLYQDMGADEPNWVLDLETHYVRNISIEGRLDGVFVVRNTGEQEKPTQKVSGKVPARKKDAEKELPKNELEYGVDGWAGVARFSHQGTSMCSTREGALKAMRYLEKISAGEGGKMYLMHIQWDAPTMTTESRLNLIQLDEEEQA